MRILLLTSGRQFPSSRFRALPYASLVERMGHVAVVAPSVPPQYEAFGWLGWRLSGLVRRGRRAIDLVRAAIRPFDVIYIERELFADDSSAWEKRFRDRTARLVLDVDDAVFLPHPEKFDAVARLCDMVICGNQRLAERARSATSNVIVIPTCVDVDRFTRTVDRPNDPTPVVIGWTGLSSNIRYLELVAPALKEIARRWTIELRVISDRSDPIEALDLAGVSVRFVRWNERTEVADLCAFDIGLMPLPDEPWTRYKCGLKAIQYMALGMPVVASPVGANADIVTHDVDGFLAFTSDEWRSILERLIADPEIRRTVGRAGRKTVETRFSIAAWAPTWVSAVAPAIAGQSFARTSDPATT